ncbi:hypothetical protein MKX01_041170 [Papaver californicum]|nr:hypothetical protein MKX01_041170 [Papaver californicum]
MEAQREQLTTPLLTGGEGVIKYDNIPSTSLISSETMDDEEENSPVKQVALTVPITDDLNYQKEPLSITAISAQIAVVPLGHLMASTITNRIFFKGTRYEFTLNPGPFNVKEHVLITIFANSGAGTVYAIHIVSSVKVFLQSTSNFKKNGNDQLILLLPVVVVVIIIIIFIYFDHLMDFFSYLFGVLVDSVLWFGWAGIFRRYLVEPAEMWWPANPVQVSLFRAKGGLSRTQFFLIAFICSFAYYVLPGYLFPMLTSLSWVCSGMKGLGLGAIGLDWSYVSSYLGSPLASPWFATVKMAVGFFYHIQIWQQSKSAFQREENGCTYKTYEQVQPVPEWWFVSIFIANIAATIFACEYYNDQLQLPWWGVLVACGLAIFFTLPVGIITATTNQTPGLNIITEYIIGYLYPGRPVANICFKVYGYISMNQAITFLQDFKLGHYMKIPPNTMFMAQVVGTLIAALVYLGTAWCLMDTIPNICDTNLLPSDSPWTCPGDHVFYDASVIWGLIGPRRIVGDLGTYAAINWFFLIGAVAPLLKRWISLINMPILIGATGNMPPATAVNYTSWIVVGFLSGFVVFRYRQNWWRRHNYVLSGALDAGLAFMGLVGSNLDGCPLASCPTATGIVVEGCPVF